jgi:hypothetical protein
MRNTLLAIVVVALTASSAVAQQFGSQNDNKPTPSGRLLPLKRPPETGNSCAAYGPGFVKVEGTSTCMKIGGAISVGAGSSSGGR